MQIPKKPVKKSKAKSLAGPQLRQAILAALSRREHARRELFDKFVDRAESRDELEFIINSFADNDWQSDYRYARTIIRTKYQNSYGPNIIYQILRQQSVSQGVIDQVMEEENINWYEACLEVCTRKCATLLRKEYQQLNYCDFDLSSDLNLFENFSLLDVDCRIKLKAKVWQFVIRKGFDSENCRSAISELGL